MLPRLANRCYLWLLMVLFLQASASFGHSKQNISTNKVHSIGTFSFDYNVKEDISWPGDHKNNDEGNSHSDQLVDLEDDTDYLEGFKAAFSRELLFPFSRGKSFYYDGLPKIIGTVVIPPPELIAF